MHIERPEIENFLYREARLLDTRKFEEWFDLFTDDAIYWVPAGRDDIDPTRHVSIIHDDKAAMATRHRVRRRSAKARTTSKAGFGYSSEERRSFLAFRCDPSVGLLP